MRSSPDQLNPFTSESDEGSGPHRRPLPKPYSSIVSIDKSLEELKRARNTEMNTGRIVETLTALERALSGVVLIKMEMNAFEKRLKELRDLIAGPMEDEVDQAEFFSKAAKIEDEILHAISVFSEELDGQQSIFEASHAETMKQMKSTYNSLLERRQKLRESLDHMRRTYSGTDWQPTQDQLDRVSSLIQRFEHYPEVIRRIGKK